MNKKPSHRFDDQLIQELMAKMSALRMRFDEERNDRAPFDMTLKCTLCSDGVVTGWYREPLYGGMTCSTPGCMKLHF
ncbi:hypothetical protein M673_03205 [Aureimonas sp. AU20]|nr:hypothetical protein M673_03205 [Aureimonas sp. AU20]